LKLTSYAHRPRSNTGKTDSCRTQRPLLGSNYP
jgi:hypothetical protein